MEVGTVKMNEFPHPAHQHLWLTSTAVIKGNVLWLWLLRLNSPMYLRISTVLVCGELKRDPAAPLSGYSRVRGHGAPSLWSKRKIPRGATTHDIIQSINSVVIL